MKRSIGAGASGGAFSSFLSVQGEDVRVLTGPDSGRMFFASVLAEQPDAVQFETSNDARERVVVSFRMGAAPDVSPGDEIQSAAGAVWRLGERINNESDVAVDFRAVKKTDQDQ